MLLLIVNIIAILTQNGKYKRIVPVDINEKNMLRNNMPMTFSIEFLFEVS